MVYPGKIKKLKIVLILSLPSMLFSQTHIGNDATTNKGIGNNTHVLGDKNEAKTDHVTVIGHENTAFKDHSTAVGIHNYAGGKYSVSVGADNGAS